MTRGRALDFMIAGTFAALLALSSAMRLEPTGRLSIGSADLGATCTFHRLTSKNCPFCGSTRSMVALFDGRLRDSWRSHPLGISLAAVFATTALAVAAAAAHHRAPVIETRLFTTVMLSLIAASLCLWSLSGLQQCADCPRTPKEVAE